MASTARRASPSDRRAGRLPPIALEYKGARLGDVRRTRRLVRLGKQLSRRPGASFPSACRSAAELEGCYRLLNSQWVQWGDVLAPHVAQTLKRCRAEAEAGRPLVVAHDTSSIRFLGSEPGVREGLAQLNRGESGFEAHLALATSLPSAEQVLAHPLGVVGLEPHVRPPRKKRSLKEQRKESAARPRGERESEMWERLAVDVQQKCTAAGLPQVVHVMDREADSFRLFFDLQRGGCAFVIRTRANRHLAGLAEGDEGEASATRMHAALEAAAVQLTREVVLGYRRGRWKGGVARTRKASWVPPRPSRTAQLQVRAVAGLRLQATKHMKRDADAPASLTLNAVEVFEPSPPEGEQEPVRWVLLTTLPVGTPEEVALVVDCYRARWTVEEYFKALKTGCALEKRQLMSLHALLNALTLLIPLAWRLLALRTLAHEAPTTPASRLFNADELAVLKHLSVRVKLSRSPTCGEALRAVAGLGGHLKDNGPPGWLTLGRGMEQLLTAVEGFRAAKGRRKKR